MILITGAAGFIGSRVALALNSKKRYDLILADHLDHSEKWKNLRGLIYEDYFDRDQLMDFLSKAGNIEAVIHLGACSSTTEKDSHYLMENNYRYTRRLSEWCLEHSVRFIYASSAATYGDGSKGYSDAHETIPDLVPLNMYGYSKQLFDRIALQKGWLDHMAGLKFFNIYGPNEYHKGPMISVVLIAFQQIMETGIVKLFKSCHPDYNDGGQLRDFIYIKDVENTILYFLEHPEINGIFNVGTGQARSFRDLVRAVFSALDMKTCIEYIDMPEELKGNYQNYTQADTTKLARTGCPTSFTALETGIEDYVINYLKPVYHKGRMNRS